ncbi:MAG: L,D-transpeptidase [Synechococcales bacterium]|nr:L,D-transpeptidase [Synechococcales bacterium]
MAVTIQRSPLGRNLMCLFLGVGLLFGAGRMMAVPLLLPEDSRSTPRKTHSPQMTFGPRAEDTQVVVDLSDRVVYVRREGKQLASYRVAIGQAGWETPIGNFRIRQMMQNPTWQHPLTDEIFPPGLQNPLGTRWIGFASDEHMHIGFHGTRQESLIGQAVSHGCIRMTNRDVQQLYEQVSIGTQVSVRR